MSHIPAPADLDRTRVEKAAVDAGFDITPALREGWLEFRSSAFPQVLGVAIQPAKLYRLGFSDAGWGRQVADDGGRSVRESDGPWPARLEAVAGFDELHLVLMRAARLARLGGDETLTRFQARTKGLPATTEAERLVVQRVGQDIFREALIEYWQGRCAVTGLDVLPLLRASHIKPWKDCASGAERLNVFNGLLLAPHLDALFDGGWISFTDGGEMLVSPHLSDTQCILLGIVSGGQLLHIARDHLPWLDYHRKQVFKMSAMSVLPSTFHDLDKSSGDGQ